MAARWPSVAARRARSEAAYRADPLRSLRPPSLLSRWAIMRLGRIGRPAHVLELGCGSGRDSRALASAGHAVLAIDFAPRALALAREATPKGLPIAYRTGEALGTLEATPTGSVDAVFANLFYMSQPDRAVDRILGEVRRVLAPGGVHLFAVRSVSDPHARRGRPFGPDVRIGRPHAGPYRYYRRATLDAMTRRGFVRERAELTRSRHLWRVCDRRADVPLRPPP